MVKRVTIDDVATLAGVHKGTVSRALNTLTSHQVNAATVRRIQRAAKQLGYVPNVMARGLRTNSSMTIGVIVPDLTNPVFPPILRGIEDQLSEHGYTALIANTDGKDAVELAAFESLLARRVDGFILATGHTDHPLLASAHQRGVRVVLVNRGSAEVAYPSVTADDASGTAAAVEHLFQLGHRDYLHIAGPPNFSTSRMRRDAFTNTMARHAGAGYDIVEATMFSVDAGFAAMNAALDSGDFRATAVVAANDLLALGVTRALRQRGIDCPGEVSVVGFNDIPFAEDFDPPLTTIRIPHHRMGYESAKLLLQGIAAGEQSPVGIVLPVSLIVRGSTGPYRPRT